jgi:hypothetical protein
MARCSVIERHSTRFPLDDDAIARVDPMMLRHVARSRRKRSETGVTVEETGRNAGVIGRTGETFRRPPADCDVSRAEPTEPYI